MRRGVLTGPWVRVLLVAGGAHSWAAAGGDEVQLQGQMVCSACWFEADRDRVPYGTKADLECAADCARKSIPAALAVRGESGFTLYVLEAGAYRAGGEGWLPLIGKHVAARGTVEGTGPRPRLRVSELTEVAGMPALREAGPPLPPDAGTPERAATDLVLPDLSGVAQTLASLRGRIVVLNFWATWCVPCREEMPALVRIQDRFGAWGVQVVGVSVDGPTPDDQIREFARRLMVNFPIWTGAGTGDMVRFGLPPALPGTVILDREGLVAARFPGAVREKDLAPRIEALLRPDASAVADP